MLVPDWQESTNRYPRRWPNEVDEFLTLVDPPVSVCELLLRTDGNGNDASLWICRLNIT
jgi:hypothetical protein